MADMTEMPWPTPVPKSQRRGPPRRPATNPGAAFMQMIGDGIADLASTQLLQQASTKTPQPVIYNPVAVKAAPIRTSARKRVHSKAFEADIIASDEPITASLQPERLSKRIKARTEAAAVEEMAPVSAPGLELLASVACGGAAMMEVDGEEEAVRGEKVPHVAAVQGQFVTFDSFKHNNSAPAVPLMMAEAPAPGTPPPVEAAARVIYITRTTAKRTRRGSSPLSL